MRYFRSRCPLNFNFDPANELGQTLILVLVLIVVLTMGVGIMVQTELAQAPLVSNAALDHDAYRALQAGTNALLYEINDSFQFGTCNSDNTPSSSNPPGVSVTPTPACSHMTNFPGFRTWIAVPNTQSAGAVPEFYAFGNPTWSSEWSPGGGTVTSETVSVIVLGAAGYPSNTHYQKQTVTFSSTNQFLHALWWENIMSADGAMYLPAKGGSGVGNPYPNACDWWNWAGVDGAYDTNNNVLGVNPTGAPGWPPFSGYPPTFGPPQTPNETVGPDALDVPGQQCGAIINFAPIDTLSGPVYSNDSIYVFTNSLKAWPVFDGPIYSSDPFCRFVDESNSVNQADPNNDWDTYPGCQNVYNNMLSWYNDRCSAAGGCSSYNGNCPATGSDSVSCTEYSYLKLDGTYGTSYAKGNWDIATSTGGPLDTASLSSSCAATYGSGTSKYYNCLAAQSNYVFPVYQPVPPVNSLAQQHQDAINAGCVFQGPTQITFGLHNGSDQMEVLSNYQAENSVQNPSCTLTLGSGGYSAWVPIPSNGVVYVDPAPKGSGCNNSQPPASKDEPEQDKNESSISLGCRGDAIVNGVFYGALSVIADNNVIVDGPLVYCGDPSLGSTTPKCPSIDPGVATSDFNQPQAVPCYPDPNNNPPQTCTGSNQVKTSAVLGLIAANFVEINNPMSDVPSMSGGSCPNSDSLGLCGAYVPCSSSNWNGGVPTWSAGLGLLHCTMTNEDVDAAIIALTGTFTANGFDIEPCTTPGDTSTCSYLSSPWNLNIDGAIAQYYRGQVGETFVGETFGTGAYIGYAKNYYYDARLAFTGPPDFVQAGINGNPEWWALDSATVPQHIACSSFTWSGPSADNGANSLPCSSPYGS